MHVTECPRCWKAKWHATGHFNVNRFNRRRAELVCDSCRYAFSSSRPDAIEAGEAVTLPTIPPVPHPTVHRLAPPGDRPAEFVSAGELARTVLADYKRRQSGEVDE